MFWNLQFPFSSRTSNPNFLDKSGQFGGFGAEYPKHRELVINISSYNAHYILLNSSTIVVMTVVIKV
jgi:hypothetical protein